MALAHPGGMGLGGKLLLSLAVVLCLATAVSVGAFFPLYHHELAAESRLAARRLTQALGFAFEAGAVSAQGDAQRALIGRLAGIEGVAAVSLLGADLRPRLTTGSAPNSLPAAGLEALCAGCGLAGEASTIGTALMQAADGRPVLRTVMALAPAAGGGFLVVDHDPAPLHERARRTAFLVSLGAVLITLFALAATWLALRRFVLAPIVSLRHAAWRIASGDLQARVPRSAPRGDEMATLATAFNAMADRLVASMAGLRERDEFLQGLIDAVPDGIRVIAADYSIVAANRNFARQVGRAPQDIIGRPCYAVSHGRSEPCVPTLVVCPLAQLARGEGPVKCTHMHRRGEEDVAVEVIAAPLTVTEAGTARRFVVEAIREVSQEVEVSLGQRLSEIGQLATGVAHEIHNPLASVQFGLRALQDAVGCPGRSAEVEGYIALVSHEIERCIEVTGRLMRLSETRTGQGTLVDIGAVTRGIASLLRYEAESRGIALAVELRDNPRIIACESDIGMVLVNLLQNAFHATPTGGRITVCADVLPEGDVVITVADNGSGIASADLERVFLPFWSRRADHSEGSGLGLPICKALVRKWHGSISVSSREGQGTTFRLVFASPEKVLEAA